MVKDINDNSFGKRKLKRKIKDIKEGKGCSGKLFLEEIFGILVKGMQQLYISFMYFGEQCEICISLCNISLLCTIGLQGCSCGDEGMGKPPFNFKTFFSSIELEQLRDY